MQPEIISADEIVPNLFLGDLADAKIFPGERLCVLEGKPSYPGMTHWIPILQLLPPWHEPLMTEREGFVGWEDFEHNQDVAGRLMASRAKLNEAADLISSRLESGARLLVHCIAGIERSPLTVAWWLCKTRRYSDMREAYKFLQSIRPVVEDRRHWIEP
jgi:predicted protein tyrosine phosphatase